MSPTFRLVPDPAPVFRGEEPVLGRKEPREVEAVLTEEEAAYLAGLSEESAWEGSEAEDFEPSAAELSPELGGEQADETGLAQEWRTIRSQVVDPAAATLTGEQPVAEADPGSRTSGSGWLRGVGPATQGEWPEGEGIGSIIDAARAVGNVVGGATGLLTAAIQAPFAEFLRRLDVLERSATSDGYGLVERVTAFRKLFYDSRGAGGYPGSGGGTWNLLIPGAAATRLPPSWVATAAAADLQYLRSHPVQFTSGAQVDMGHLFAGLDARHHPTDVSFGMLGFPLVRMRSNLEATTFTGDLGSVVVEYIHASTRSFRDTAMELDGPSLDKAYDAWASAADMAADADAHVVRLDPARTLTDNLSAYYTAATGGVRQRWHGFVDRIRLGTFTPSPPASGPYVQALVIGTFSGSTDRWRSDMRGEVMNAALAYAAATGRRTDVVNVLGKARPGIVTPTFWEMYWNVSGWVVEEFLRRLKTAVKGEFP